MAIYINKETNSLEFNSEDYDKNYNYMPSIVMALMDLDNSSKIKIAINLDKTPVIFVLYFRRLIQESGSDIKIFYKEDSIELRDALISYGMEYNSLKDFPDYEIITK